MTEDEALLAAIARARTFTLRELGWLACAVLTAAALIGCSHRAPDLRPDPPGKVEAHITAFPPTTIAWRPVTFYAYVDDPLMVFPCPDVTWTWPNGTHTYRASDCAPDELQPRHSGGVYRIVLGPGDQTVSVRFASRGREVIASVTVPVQ